MADSLTMIEYSAHIKRPSTPLANNESGSIKLPHIEDHMRALSNPIARSALFTVGNRAQLRPNRKRFKIVAVSGVVMTYTGEALYQDDHDVFMSVCYIGSMHPLGTVVKFTAYALLKHLGWTPNPESYERLKAVLDRLSATSLSVTFTAPGGTRVNYTGSLVRSFRWRSDGDEFALTQWELLLEPEIVALFGRDSFTRLNWDIHKTLKNAGMAKWLHNFYSTHQYPYAYSCARVKELMASEAKSMAHFRADLKKALEKLVKAGFLVAWVITAEDRLQLVRVGFEDKVKMKYGAPELLIDDSEIDVDED